MKKLYEMTNNNKSTLIFITGGARSGKSNYAQQQALMLSTDPVYVATAKVYANDEEFKQRVQKHIADRNKNWTSIEEQFYISKLSLENKVVVIDCVTLWLTNFFSLYKCDAHQTLQAIKNEIETLQNIPATFFIISNEIGMGVHAEAEIGRRFTDLQGWANQYIAAKATKVVFMISGIPVTIKDKQ